MHNNAFERDLGKRCAHPSAPQGERYDTREIKHGTKNVKNH